MVYALSDLGESINLMPLYVFNTLGLGQSRPCSIVLQMENILRVVPKEIIEDVLIKVCQFIIPSELIILDYNAYDKVPIILSIHS